MGRRYDDRRWIENPDGSFSRKPQEESSASAVSEPIAAEHNENYYADIQTTGAAAQLAAELGVDLGSIEGTGKNGRITKGDVEAAAGK